MPSGLLAKILTTGAAFQEIVTVPSEAESVLLSVRVMNDTNDDATVRLYLSTSDQPSAADKIMPTTELKKVGGFLNMDCEHCSPGERLFIETTAAGLVVRVTAVLEE